MPGHPGPGPKRKNSSFQRAMTALCPVRVIWTVESLTCGPGYGRTSRDYNFLGWHRGSFLVWIRIREAMTRPAPRIWNIPRGSLKKI